MPEHSDYYFFLKELFPGAGPELMRLLQGAAENTFLLRSDFDTIRDWVEIADCRDEDVVHAILLLMLVALEEGSLCVEVTPAALLRRLLDFVPQEEAVAWAQHIGQWIHGPGCPALMGTSPQEHKPVILHAVGSERFLYFQKYLRAELDFLRLLNQRLPLTEASTEPPWPKIVPEVLSGQTLVLDRDQQHALAAALVNNLTIISGGPGTGKTSIVLTLLRCLVRGGCQAERIALAAPTGRAAQRLTDSLRAGLGRLQAADARDSGLLEVGATTLHHLLGYRPTSNRFSRHAENPIPADAVIIDEVSMVGLVLMSQLLQALAPQTRLILLGDKDQLPSVEAGAVLAHLVPEGRGNGCGIQQRLHLTSIFPELEIPHIEPASPLQERVVLLRTNHRSQQHIRETADAINRQDTGVVDRLPALTFVGEGTVEACWQDLERQGGCQLLEQSQATAHELRGFLHHWVEQAYFSSKLDGLALAELITSVEVSEAAAGVSTNPRLKQLFLMLDRFRLLTLVRDSAWGCDEINRYLAHYLRPRLEEDARTPLFAGAPVLITRNDPARGLYNGDVGITLRRADGALRVVFQRQDGHVALPTEALPGHELGFALTVHKSQGSEYDHVMVVLPPTGGKRLLTKELIYTAITRARTLAVICSTKDVLKFAIGRKIVRESGLLRF
jgi:exodeoxyribonuclease V alpha subunit